jgi:hypothetical protein
MIPISRLRRSSIRHPFAFDSLAVFNVFFNEDIRNDLIWPILVKG